jgi:integrase/recombinase XerD
MNPSPTPPEPLPAGASLALPGPSPEPCDDNHAHGTYTAASLTEAWLATKSENTQRAYRRDLTVWLAWCGERGLSPATARIADVDAWMAGQRDAGAAVKSISRRVAAVSSWYDYLVVNTAQDPEPLITYNPALTKNRPHVDRDYSPTTALSQAAAEALIAGAHEDSATSGALIRLLLTGGLRVGSALDARIEDMGVDGPHQVVTLHLKGGKTQRVPLAPPVKQAIDVMLAERGNPAEGWLFITPAGGHLYQVRVWRLVRKLAATCPHGLRATAITELLRAGVPLHHVQDFAGHADPRTTQLYNKARRGLDGHGAYLLASRFASPPEQDG